MRKRKLLSLTVSSLVLVAAGGCNRSIDLNVDGIPQHVASHIDSIRVCLRRGGVGCDFLGEYENTIRLFCCLSNSTQQVNAAAAYAKMLRMIELKDLPYPLREGATLQYGRSVRQCFEIMRRCNVSPKESMDFLFDGLSKYKDSCYSVALDFKVPGETQKDARRRRECGLVLRDDCAMQLSYIKRSWIPNLSRCLPKEYHDEFVRRLDVLTVSKKEAVPCAESAGPSRWLPFGSVSQTGDSE